MNTAEKIEVIEEDIKEWAKLLAHSKTDSTKFEVRAENLERLLSIRRGLMCMFKHDGIKR